MTSHINIKQKGTCPFCGKNVAAVITEENKVRRDLCQCPECGEPILLCRGLGCHDYAKGTPFYDNEYCPDCTKKISDVASEVGKAVLKVGVVVASFVATAALGKGKK
jgi:uncharacterized protein with PIN domain